MKTRRILSILLTLALAVGLLALMPITASAADTVTPMIAGKSNHTLVLKSDGTVWAWGRNYYGQLGNGTSITSAFPNPVQVMASEGVPLTDVVAVEVGSDHSLVLKSDGTVWAWGYSQYGQLGNGVSGTASTELYPVQVKGAGGSGYLTGVTAISASSSHNLALKNDGTVWAWGYNYEGQLGDGTNTLQNTPVQVKGIGGTGNLTGIKAVAAGGYNSMALQNDGTVLAWGYNSDGQVGDGTKGGSTSKNTPVQVKGEGGTGNLTNIIAIASGGITSLALKSDGTVWSWGNNVYGQLGNGKIGASGESKSTPVQVKGAGGTGNLTGVTAITISSCVLALKNDGTVWAWGYNSYGRLGDGTTENRLTPVQVKGAGGVGYLSDVTAVSTGDGRSMALKSDGTIFAWGNNSFGQIGDGTQDNKTTPVQAGGIGFNLTAPSFAVTVNSAGAGAGINGSYSQGSVVSIYAGTAPAGKLFDRWTSTSPGVAFANANSASTTFTMPGNAVTVTAEFKDAKPAKGIFGTNAKWHGAWWHYILFFIGFGFIWMWF